MKITKKRKRRVPFRRIVCGLLWILLLGGGASFVCFRSSAFLEFYTWDVRTLLSSTDPSSGLGGHSGVLTKTTSSRTAAELDNGVQQQLLLAQSSSRSKNATTAPPLPSDGAFIHTGKTGGSTLSVLLRNGCHSFMHHPCRESILHESFASRRIESYYHVPDFGRLPTQTQHRFYVMTCRDPFDRTVSAFVFDHIRNRYARNETVDPYKTQKYEDAYRCFPTLQRFVEHLGNDPLHFKYPYKQNWVAADSCSDLAKAALHGRVKIYNHLFFSFQMLLSFIPTIQNKTLYAIRQDYLWDDWISVNRALGQTDPVYIPEDDGSMLRNVTFLEASNKMPVTRDLNEVGQSLLCNALRMEYRAYFWLLQRAKNVSTDEVQHSIDYAKRKCPSLNVDEIVRRVAPEPKAT